MILDDDGTIIDSSSYFPISIKSRVGDSGGIVVDEERRLAGIVSGGCIGSPRTSVVRLKKALEMISYYVSHLDRKWA